MASAYGKATRHTALWVLIILGGVLVMSVLFATLSRNGWADRLGGWMLLVGVLPIAVSVAFALLITNRLNRSRIAGLVRPLELAGFAVTPSPTPEEKTHFGAPLEELMTALGFRYGVPGVQWYAIEPKITPAALLFEHEYVTGSGKSTQVHSHTVLAWPAAHPALRLHSLGTSPAFGLGRFSWWLRRVYKDREVTDPAFADLRKRWTMFGSAETGKQFLTEHVRSILQQSPAGEQWYVGAGWVVCCFRGTLDSENIESFLKHARAIAQPQ
jgi:hypothetical protein